MAGGAGAGRHRRFLLIWEVREAQQEYIVLGGNRTSSPAADPLQLYIYITSNTLGNCEVV